MPSRLVDLDGGLDIPVDRSPIVVGRHPLCDVRLQSVRVSRRHCCLTEVDGEVVVRDLGSRNGTEINGRRVEAGRLRPGDVLSIANLRYRMEPGRAARPEPRAGQAAAPPPVTLCDPSGTSLQDPS